MERCPHCGGELIDKGHGPGGAKTCRNCLADVLPKHTCNGWGLHPYDCQDELRSGDPCPTCGRERVWTCELSLDCEELTCENCNYGEHFATHRHEAELRGYEIDIMSRSFKRQGIGRGEARRLARVWVDTEDLPKGKRKGAAARLRTQEDRRNRLDRRGRCWRKIGFVTAEAYCGRHGRNAGWPCAR